MKIAILSPASLSDFEEYLGVKLPSGLEFAALTPIIKYYLRNNHEVVLVTLDKTILKAQIYSKGNLTVYVGKYRKIAKIRALDNFYYEVRQMISYLKRNPCDIYHAHWSYEFALAALAVCPRRTLITLHDWAPRIYDFFHDYYRKKRLKMNDRVIKEGLYFSTVSPYIAEEFFNRFDNKEMFVVPNCIEYSHTNGKREIREKKRIICANNGFEPRKNVETAIKAFKLLKKDQGMVELYLYGAGFEPGGACELWVKQEHIDPSGIHFCGPVSHEDIMNKMADADVFLHTSREESFGLVLVEAMIAGTPVIGGKKSGAVPWVLDNGNAGMLVDVENADEICEALGELLYKPHVWRHYSENGHAYVVNNFLVKSVAEKYINIYESICSN